MPPFSGGPGFTDIRVRVQPRSSRCEVVGEHGGALKVRVAAPPVDGAANEELVRFLARCLGVPRSALELVRGTTGRNKVLRVRGLSPQECAERLGS